VRPQQHTDLIQGGSDVDLGVGLNPTVTRTFVPTSVLKSWMSLFPRSPSPTGLAASVVEGVPRIGVNASIGFLKPQSVQVRTLPTMGAEPPPRCPLATGLAE